MLRCCDEFVVEFRTGNTTTANDDIVALWRDALPTFSVASEECYIRWTCLRFKAGIDDDLRSSAERIRDGWHRALLMHQDRRVESVRENIACADNKHAPCREVGLQDCEKCICPCNAVAIHPTVASLHVLGVLSAQRRKGRCDDIALCCSMVARRHRSSRLSAIPCRCRRNGVGCCELSCAGLGRIVIVVFKPEHRNSSDAMCRIHITCRRSSTRDFVECVHRSAQQANLLSGCNHNTVLIAELIESSLLLLRQVEMPH